MALKNSYLLLYNLVSLLAWTYLTTRVILTLVAGAAPSPLLADITALQTAASLEVAHAALGLVRSSPGTTALQVGGRNLVIWTVMRRFPDLVFGGAWGRRGFIGCLLAWGASDILRYAFFVAQLSSGGAAGWLKWLRYTAFIPLYPIGFLSEASLVYLGLVEGAGIGPVYRAYLFVGLLTYIPASYILYTYMFSQRRRALGQAKRTKRS
ncbi:PTPLA-domain-containing protein [Xylaria telfairii]|nr:PTPLA-domain-containing protein [Xylaria telfairii]